LALSLVVLLPSHEPRFIVCSLSWVASCLLSLALGSWLPSIGHQQSLAVKEGALPASPLVGAEGGFWDWPRPPASAFSQLGAAGSGLGKANHTLRVWWDSYCV
jgi:hypothetical protein